MDTQRIIKDLRNETGLSQAKFAEKFSIPKSTYEQWEMGLRKPPEYVINMIATILDYEKTSFGGQIRDERK